MAGNPKRTTGGRTLDSDIYSLPLMGSLISRRPSQRLCVTRPNIPHGKGMLMLTRDLRAMPKPLHGRLPLWPLGCKQRRVQTLTRVLKRSSLASFVGLPLPLLSLLLVSIVSRSPGFLKWFLRRLQLLTSAVRHGARTIVTLGQVWPALHYSQPQRLSN